MKKSEKLSIVQKEISRNIISKVLSGSLYHKSQVSNIYLQPVVSQIEEKGTRIFNKTILSQMGVNSFYQSIDWMINKELIERTGRADMFIMTGKMWKIVLTHARVTLSPADQNRFVSNFKLLK